MEKYLLELKKKRDKNHKIKTTKLAIYSEGGSPNMETPSSYLKKFYKKQGFDGYHSQNYFNRYSLTLDNGSKNITICFLRSNTYRKESKQNFC